MKQTIIFFTILLCCCSEKKVQLDGDDFCFIDLHRFLKRIPQFVLTQSTDCIQTKLSNHFDIHIHYKRYDDTINGYQQCFVEIQVRDKSTNEVLDNFSIDSSAYYSFMFSTCDSVRSYTTGYNADHYVGDGYYGDIVVADLNFDGLEDIAAYSNIYYDSDPTYNYYLQTKDRKFLKNSFLSDSMGIFPTKINAKNRTLTTYAFAGMCYIGEHAYKLDRVKNTWTQTSHRFIDICPDSVKNRNAKWE